MPGSPHRDAASSRRLLLLLATAAVLLVVFVVRWASEPNGEVVQSDFVPLQVAGVIVRDGEAAHLYDPVLQARVYAVATRGSHPGTLFYIHAPLAAAVMVPISLAALDTGFRLMGVLQLACLITAAFIAARAAPASPRRRDVTALAVGVAVAAPTTLLMLREGQDVGLAALLLAGAYVAMRSQRPAAAGALLVVAAAAGKPHLFLGVAVWVIFRGDRRMLAGAAAGLAASALASLALVGPGGLSGFVSALLSGRSDFRSAQESLGGLFTAWTGGGTVAALLTTVATAAALVAVAVAARRGAANRLGLEPSLAVAVALSLLAAPHLYPHDLALLAPVFAWMTVAAVTRDQHTGTSLPGPATTTLLLVWLLLATCVAVDAVAALPAGAGSLGPFALMAAAIAAARLRGFRVTPIGAELR